MTAGVAVLLLLAGCSDGDDLQVAPQAKPGELAKVQDKLEKLSVADALRAVDFAEVVVLLLDATLGLEAQDLRIADMVLQEGRALLVALNKWDAAEEGADGAGQQDTGGAEQARVGEQEAGAKREHAAPPEEGRQHADRGKGRLAPCIRVERADPQ